MSNSRALAFVGTTVPLLSEPDYSAARSGLDTFDVVLTPAFSCDDKSSRKQL